MTEYSQKWHNGTSRTRSTETSDGLAAIQAQLNNLGREIKKVNEKVYAAQVGCEQCKEIRASTDDAIRNQGASIKTLEIQIGKMSKVLQERRFGSLLSSTETNPRDHVKSISTTIKADPSLIRRIGSSQYAVSTRQNSTLMYETRQTMIPFQSQLNDYYCKGKNGSYGLQFLEAYSYGASHIDNSIPRKEKDPGRASVSVMPLSTYLNLGLDELAHTKLTVELADRTVKYPKGIAKNMLVGIGKFIFPVDFIILDMPEDIKVPLILERPFFLRERTELDLEARLIGETLVLNRSLDPLNGDYIELNDLNVPLKLRRDQVDDLMPIIEEDFAVLEDMDAYRDEGMGDVIFGEPFLREVVIKARRFDGMITIYNGDESITYQIMRSHPRFKHHTNEQCNKIPTLLKDLILSECPQWKNSLHAGTLACMRWNGEGS
ncbi:retrovirus-related pol polyprotein from transposon TNT 1-94 [Tanacetum coccineum]